MSLNLRPEKIERVVVRGVNWVGDAVMTVPALRELRRLFPRARLTLATRPWAEGIFAGADFIDDLLVNGNSSSKPAAVYREAREWRARRFDLALLFPNSFAPALVALLAGVPARVGYATQGRSALLTHPAPVPAWRGQRHEVYYYLHLVGELERQLYGSPSTESREPDVALRVTDARLREVTDFLLESGARPGRPLVAICPGSTNSRAKRWPAERYAAVADMLHEKAGAEVLLIGAAEELEISEEVARRMRARPIVLTGKTDLAQTAAVLKASDLLVANDTGPAHVGAAVGCPVLVIFGPTNPVTTRPFSETAEVVRRPPDCAPCMLRDCPIDHRCMTAITPEDVYERAARALKLSQKVEVAR
ncbi:MAG: lipopolysaccharide heptosyltransferase II [Pyrinomonadaceae bacterium]